MFIDLIVVVLIIIGIFKGLRKGFVVGLFSFLAFIVGIAAALKLSVVAAAYLGSNANISQRWLPVLAFVLVFLLVVFLVHLGAKALEAVLRIVLLGWLNKLGGVLLFTLLYLFLFSVLLFYAAQLHIINEATIEASVTYPYLIVLAPKVIGLFATILPFFKNMFAELSNFFGNVAKQS